MAEIIDPSDRPACRPGQPCRMTGLRLLLVDDDPVRRMKRSRVLIGHGFDVLTAADPSVAVATLRAGAVCDIAVVELERGARAAVATINALRGFRAWLPAVLIGGATPPEGAVLVDRYVKTTWLPDADQPLALFFAILDASCPGRRPDDCPYGGCAGPVRHDTVLPETPRGDWMAAAPKQRPAGRMFHASGA